MKHLLISAVLLACVTAAPVAAAPGDPFGGSETGCIPANKNGVTCGKTMTGSLGKLLAGVLKCHAVQATAAFKAGASSPEIDAAEEACTAAVKAKFDGAAAKAGAYCAAGIVPAAEARRDGLLADASTMGSLDGLNAFFFCDATSGLTIASPGGGDQDEPGSIPATPDNQKCALGVIKALSKLASGVYKCHAKSAGAGFGGKPYNTAACDDAPKGSRAKYVATINKYIAAGICPPCVTDSGSMTNALALAGLLGGLDAQNEEIYPCPAP